LEGYFLGTQLPQLSVENIYSLLVWPMFGKSPQDANALEWEQVRQVFDELKDTFPGVFCNIKQGFTPSVRHVDMTLLLRINFTHRPLVLHLLTAAMDFSVSNSFLRCARFSRHKFNGVMYWI
jgi:hypothetical protein